MNNKRFYELLSNNDYESLKGLRIDFNDPSINELIEYLFSDEDILYFLNKSEFEFNPEDLDKLRQYAIRYEIDNYSNNYHNGFRSYEDLFTSSKEFNKYIYDNSKLFTEYLTKVKNPLNSIISTQAGLTIILKNELLHLLPTLDNISSYNLKLLASKVGKGIKLSTINKLKFDSYFIKALFSHINEITKEEFYTLINLVDESNKLNKDIFDLIVSNSTYLMECFTGKTLPYIVTLDPRFRDLCIEANRFDLAIQCLLPLDILDKPKVLEGYANALGISKQTLCERMKTIIKIYSKNNDIDGTILGLMLKDGISDIPINHYERMVNDISFQLKLNNLNEKEISIINLILNRFDYINYDVTLMIDNIISNISSYKELIDSISIDDLYNNAKRLNNLVSLLQYSNVYGIKSIKELDEYYDIKRSSSLEQSNDLDTSKDYLLRHIFNIDLEEAKRINELYCYYRGTNILDQLANSELPDYLYYLLTIINDITECNNIDFLNNYKKEHMDDYVYNYPVPLETYLRSQYTQMYDNSLYKGTEEQSEQVKYNGQEIKAIIPKGNFNFLVHRVGTCETFAGESYKEDWLERPSCRDHYVACSYLNQDKFLDIRSGSGITYGFNNLAGGSIITAGSSDIDSIGYYSKKYNSTKIVSEQYGRTQFLPPSVLLRYTTGYNELVIERRNSDGSIEKDYKRSPDYIIYPVTSLDSKAEFTTVEEFFETKLPFITQEEKTRLLMYDGTYGEIDGVNVTRYLSNIYKKAINDSTISNKYKEELEDIKNNYKIIINNLFKAKLYSDSLKAAGEYGIPLLVIDHSYYMDKAINDSNVYSDSEKTILKHYIKDNPKYKRDFLGWISKGLTFDEIMSNINKREQTSKKGVTINV